MSEYIDKHATAEHIDMYAKLLTMGDYRSGMMKAKEILLNQESVDIAPSIPKIIRGTDIVPVVHGKWMKEDRGHVEYCAVCDQCGFDWMWSDRGYFKFCPNCGARMDGGKED